MTPQWIKAAQIYHIYPLGLCGAPPRNDFAAEPHHRLRRLHGWLDHIQRLGMNTIYLGPVFESSAHGYDTADYFRVDRRLGDNDTLKHLVADMKARGLRVVLDGVFNHVGRDFWAFQDVLKNGVQSPYCDWFAGLRFDQVSAYGDPFVYEGWAGHYDLVKLNLHNPVVVEHLLTAVSSWITVFDIDGLRLDAADHIAPDFFCTLRQHCQQQKHDFWLMGEVVHGDYRGWANDAMLHATTNYECYKGLYSSHVDRNYFEIAYSLKRQFGPDGMYRHLHLYNFADNHDVNRVASNVTAAAHLYTLYGILFTMPGVPSVYYGSEWGLDGRRTVSSDHALRPALDLRAIQAPHPDLAEAIRRFANIRQHSSALKVGNYQELIVTHEQLAFQRQSSDETIVVLVNAADHTATLTLKAYDQRTLVDLLEPSAHFAPDHGVVHVNIPPHWLRICRVMD